MFLEFAGSVGSPTQASWEPANFKNNYSVEINVFRIYRLLGSLTQAFWEPANSKNNYLVEITFLEFTGSSGARPRPSGGLQSLKAIIWTK